MAWNSGLDIRAAALLLLPPVPHARAWGNPRTTPMVPGSCAKGGGGRSTRLAKLEASGRTNAMQVFISHSAKNDPFAQKVRSGVCDRLGALGHEILLDVGRIDPGEEWRAKLLYWLGTCRGAVILFSKDALNSDWVKIETAVLSWRRSQDPRFLLVPALLAGVKDNDTEFALFKPVQLREIQFAKVAQTGNTDEDVRAIVEAVVKPFESAAKSQSARRDDATSATGSLMDWWVEDVAVYLKPADPVHVKRAAEILAVSVDDWKDIFDGQLLRLAWLLLYTNLEKSLPALRELVKAIPVEAREGLVERLIPVWVHAMSARNIVPVAQAKAEEKRNLAINGKRSDTGVHYILRAFCSASSINVVSISDRAGASEEFVAKYDMAVLKANHIDREVDDPDVQKLVQECLDQARNSGELWFVLFGMDAVRFGVPQKLRARYRGMTFVVLSGEHLPGAEELKPLEIEMVRPELEANEEVRATVTVGKLRGLIHQR